MIDYKFRNILAATFIGFLSVIIPTVANAVTTTPISLLDTGTGTDVDERQFKVAFKDDSYVYFGVDYAYPIKVQKYDRSTLDYVATLTLSSGEEYPYAAAAYNGFAYIGTWDGTGKIIKINLSNFTRVGVLDPADGNVAYVGAAIDEENNFAYFTTNTNKLVKIDLSDFSVEGILTLDASEDGTWVNPIIDSTHDVMYLATYTSPAIVVKIDLTDFTRDSAVSLSTGEDSAYGLALDPDTQTVYVGTWINPTKIVRVNGATMQRVDATTITGVNRVAVNSLVFEPEFDKLYVLAGSGVSPKFAMIDTTDMSVEDSFAISYSESFFDSSAYDLTNKVGFFGGYGDSGTRIKVQLYDEAADPTPAPAAESTPTTTSSSPRSGERSRPIALLNAPAVIAQSPVSTQTSVINLVTQNRNLFTEALSHGITIPQFILDILGIKSATPTSGQFSARDLALGSVGEDVRMLQKVLNSQGFTISTTGEGSVGNETTTFGQLTHEALVKYQTAKGISPASGIFGPLTRNQMKSAGIPGLWW
jgi:hypothetical protein